MIEVSTLLLIIACIAFAILGGILYVGARILKNLEDIDFDLEEDEE